MLDTVRLEHAGVPTALIAVGKLARTTGRGMARVQGVPDLAITTIEHEAGMITSVGDEELVAMVQAAARQVRNVLLTGGSSGP